MDDFKMVKIVDDVRDFESWCCEHIEMFYGSEFSMLRFMEIQNLRIESPIEQMLLFALRSLQVFNYLNDLIVRPQYQIDKYRVDFYVEYRGSYLVIECDSQAFHDRTEQERRYEKKRDRYIQSKGYKTFRYTGSEIMKNAIDVAAEIISEVSGIKLCEVQKSSNYGDDWR